VYADDYTESQMVQAVLKLTGDEIAEVKNNAVSWFVSPEEKKEGVLTSR
jgi:hypothetical protein